MQFIKLLCVFTLFLSVSTAYSQPLDPPLPPDPGQPGSEVPRSIFYFTCKTMMNDGYLLFLLGRFYVDNYVGTLELYQKMNEYDTMVKGRFTISFDDKDVAIVTRGGTKYYQVHAHSDGSGAAPEASIKVTVPKMIFSPDGEVMMGMVDLGRGQTFEAQCTPEYDDYTKGIGIPGSSYNPYGGGPR